MEMVVSVEAQARTDARPAHEAPEAGGHASSRAGVEQDGGLCAPGAAVARLPPSAHGVTHRVRASMGWTVAGSPCMPAPVSRGGMTSVWAHSTMPGPTGHPAS